MTTYGPSAASVSLVERLAGAPIVVVARIEGLRDQWPDPAADATRQFGLIGAEVRETLRGDVPDRLVVRIAGTRTDDRIEWPVPVEAEQDVLLILAPDGDADPARYALQYDSAFRLHDTDAEIPDGLLAGRHQEQPGRVSLRAVAEMLEDIDAARASARFDEVESALPETYPPVEEMGDPSVDDREAPPPGPRDSSPGLAWPPDRSPAEPSD